MSSIEKIVNQEEKIAVVGLGYVGLPLAVALGKKAKVIGFDISSQRIEMLKNGEDPSKELTKDQLNATTINYTAQPSKLQEASFIIIAVPTPIDNAQNPDLTPVIKACDTVGSYLKKGSIVVFESTVYPGVTEDICGPRLEKVSGLKCGKDFKLGYSPERINPGDKEHTLEKILKIVSGQDEQTLDTVAAVYELVVEPGVHRASSIKVAEAAKVIENTQRDLNIALMNELAIIFDLLNIDSQEVLEAAGTKWNFLKFTPGLVGGHCIGVDPYYLTHKAKEMGYNPEVILAGRRINDNMGKTIAEKTIKQLISIGSPIKNENVCVLGLTFKENVSDIRNTRVTDIIQELKAYEVNVQVADPMADSKEVAKELNIELTAMESLKPSRAVIIATAHDKIRALSPDQIKHICNPSSTPILMDVRRAFSRAEMENAGILYWGL